MSKPEYKTPQTPQAAHELIERSGPNGKIVAGGQSLSLLMRQGLLNPDVIIDITTVPEFNDITVDGDRIRIGATTTYTDLENNDLSEKISVLGDAIDVIADRQVKNMGTIGGALSHADPSLDIIPPLLCLDAEVEIGSVNGTRTVPLAEFAFGYMTTDLEKEELVEAVAFDRPAGGSSYQKHANVKGGWATVGAAARVVLSDDGESIEDARLALTAVADTAVRANSVESALVGEGTSAETITTAADLVVDDIDPLEDISGSVEYKERLAKSLSKRALRAAVKRAGGEI